MSLASFIARGLSASEVGSIDDNGQGWSIVDPNNTTVACVRYVPNPSVPLELTDVFVIVLQSVTFPLQDESDYTFSSLGVMSSRQELIDWADDNITGKTDQYEASYTYSLVP